VHGSRVDREFVTLSGRARVGAPGDGYPARLRAQNGDCGLSRRSAGKPIRRLFRETAFGGFPSPTREDPADDPSRGELRGLFQRSRRA
jgi:hypothetical protein